MGKPLLSRKEFEMITIPIGTAAGKEERVWHFPDQTPVDSKLISLQHMPENQELPVSVEICSYLTSNQSQQIEEYQKVFFDSVEN